MEIYELNEDIYANIRTPNNFRKKSPIKKNDFKVLSINVVYDCLKALPLYLIDLNKSIISSVFDVSKDFNGFTNIVICF